MIRKERTYFKVAADQIRFKKLTYIESRDGIHYNEYTRSSNMPGVQTNTEKMGAFIRLKRLTMQLSQEMLARKTRLSRVTLSRLETGRQFPADLTREKLEKILGRLPALDCLLANEKCGVLGGQNIHKTTVKQPNDTALT